MNFPVKFTKMSGAGNDFILIDHRRPFIDKNILSAFARAVCRRKFSVGADGLILIETSETVDFSWTFMNGDGSLAEMCGNGARCAARFAYVNGMAPPVMRFQTLAGIIEAEVVDHSVKIRMTPPEHFQFGLEVEVDGAARVVHAVNTGVPHVICFVDDIESAPVVELGRAIRFHDLFQPAGANVNFVKILSDKQLHVRTYERGVEGETMACGTGAVAAAIIAALLGRVKPPVRIITSGGEALKIHFTLAGNDTEKIADCEISDIFLEGPARLVYEGRLTEDAVSI